MDKAGTLNRRIQFQRAALTFDGFSQVETFADHGTPIWAGRTDASDAEKARADEVQAVLMSRFLVRSSTFTRGITPKDRIVTEGVTFNVTGIKEPAGTRREWLEITAAARADQ